MLHLPRYINLDRVGINMNTFKVEQENSVSQSGSPSWETTLK